MDAFDQKILKIISTNGRITISDLSKRVGLSPTPCSLRLQKLIKDNYITGFFAQLNAEKVQGRHITFVEVKLEKTDQKTLDSFNAAVLEIPEIEQAHMIAGNFDYLLKVRTNNIQDYRKVLGEEISTLPSVKSTSTNVPMQSIKEPSKRGG